jgi:hypothetical protein
VIATEKYNPGKNAPIDASTWNTVLRKALFVEWNNTVLNLVKKVRSGYVPDVLKLFSSSDVFEGETLNLPSLLDRYKAYLVRMKAKGLNPFKDQPRRTDLHYTEAVGHY